MVVEQNYSIAARLLGRWKREFSAQFAGKTLGYEEREELLRLRKEVRMLWMEKDILKKRQPVLREGNEVKYVFIQEHEKLWPVVHLCRLLDVGRGAYPSNPNKHSTLGYTTPMDYEKNLGKVSGNG